MQVGWKLNWGPLRVHGCFLKPQGANLLAISTLGRRYQPRPVPTRSGAS